MTAIGRWAETASRWLSFSRSVDRKIGSNPHAIKGSSAGSCPPFQRPITVVDVGHALPFAPVRIDAVLVADIAISPHRAGHHMRMPLDETWHQHVTGVSVVSRLAAMRRESPRRRQRRCDLPAPRHASHSDGWIHRYDLRGAIDTVSAMVSSAGWAGSLQEYATSIDRKNSIFLAISPFCRSYGKARDVRFHLEAASLCRGCRAARGSIANAARTRISRNRPSPRPSTSSNKRSDSTCSCASPPRVSRRLPPAKKPSASSAASSTDPTLRQ